MSHALFPETTGNGTVPLGPRGSQATASRSTARRASRSAAAIALAVTLSSGAIVGLAEPAAAVSLLDARSGVVKLTNVKRAVKGCKALKVSKRLTTSAQRHANDMSKKDYFSHTSADGTTWDQRIERAGWKRPAGENIAVGFPSAVGVLKGWMDSPGHKRNILDCNFKYIGVGYAADGGYWVQDFGY